MFEKCRAFEAFRQLLSRASAVLISLHLLQSDILYLNFYLFFANLIVESYLTVLVCISWVPMRLNAYSVISILATCTSFPVNCSFQSFGQHCLVCQDKDCE